MAGFRYGQGGKKMIEAYSAVAKEGAVRMSRSTKVDPDRVRKSLDAGFPVLVWRHYDADRNRLHAMAARAPGLLPPPDEADRATWPTGNAPAHSSLITGYNADTGEVIFAESWGEHARGKRMLMEEIEATAYYIFYYSI